MPKNLDFILPRKLNICFDTSHSKLYCNWAHMDFYEQVLTLLPYTHHLHISDASGLDGEGLQIGEGTFNRPFLPHYKGLSQHHDPRESGVGTNMPGRASS